MTLHEYLHSFRESIDKIDRYGYAESVEIHQEVRAGKQALLQVTVVLVDGSSLHIKEYISAMYGVEKVSYGYQYQDVHGDVIFRYDNALHRPLLKCKEHKHMKNQIVEMPPPDIADLVDEVIGYI